MLKNSRKPVSNFQVLDLRSHSLHLTGRKTFGRFLHQRPKLLIKEPAIIQLLHVVPTPWNYVGKPVHNRLILRDWPIYQVQQIAEVSVLPNNINSEKHGCPFRTERHFYFLEEVELLKFGLKLL